MTVLERSAGKAAGGKRGVSAVCRCLECGTPLTPGPRRAEFCGRKCVRRWNNRRMVRGAEIYDLFMAVRYEREEATKNKVWRALNRLAAKFRDEDKAARGGRRSWRRLRSIIETKIFLWAE